MDNLMNALGFYRVEEHKEPDRPLQVGDWVECIRGLETKPTEVTHDR